MAQNWIPPLIEIEPEETIQLNDHNDFVKKTQFTFRDKPVWVAFVSVGDINSSNLINASGTLLSNVDQFLGIASGVIRRENGQIHNINAVNNVGVSDGKLTNTEQHLSIIYKEGSNIRWYFNTSGAFTQFMRRPFKALLLVTKNTPNGE